MSMKECTGCHKPKPLTAYTRRAASKDGLQYDCRECHQVRQRRCREARLEHYKSINLAWNKRNPEKIASYKREYAIKRQIHTILRRLERERALEDTA